MIDLNLRKQTALPLADALEGRNVPFVVATGYASSMVPACYQHIFLWEKPYHLEELVRALPALIYRS
ncbi:hypothetical protein [Microvirga aerophila]|uniref:Response regulatory domain-containing protein n=1 Tax=Microvirga aerophila TaxID=670291 RepID=A0A512C289_9HYPH|nr:hypothetical protein [Microvirga aerophila]GEO18334.1 hypothetical protein MAE02_60300 [Microvirga aerophila]